MAVSAVLCFVESCGAFTQDTFTFTGVTPRVWRAAMSVQIRLDIPYLTVQTLQAYNFLLGYLFRHGKLSEQTFDSVALDCTASVTQVKFRKGRLDASLGSMVRPLLHTLLRPLFACLPLVSRARLSSCS